MGQLKGKSQRVTSHFWSASQRLSTRRRAFSSQTPGRSLSGYPPYCSPAAADDQCPPGKLKRRRALAITPILRPPLFRASIKRTGPPACAGGPSDCRRTEHFPLQRSRPRFAAALTPPARGPPRSARCRAPAPSPPPPAAEAATGPAACSPPACRSPPPG